VAKAALGVIEPPADLDNVANGAATEPLNNTRMRAQNDRSALGHRGAPVRWSAHGRALPAAASKAVGRVPTTAKTDLESGGRIRRLLSERALEKPSDIADFQAEYEGSIPFTRSKRTAK